MCIRDRGTDFFEIGTFAAYDMYLEYGNIASAGIVTGIGKINKKDCMIIANDATVKAGAYFEITLKNANSKLITRDSVNMVFESLSCKGKTYLMDMKKIRSSNKVVKVIDSLIENKKIGFIDCSDITDGMSKMKLQKQNIHNEIYAEVEKISYKLLQLI